MKLQELNEATGTKQEIATWLDKYNVVNYTINDDLSVDVEGHVTLRYQELESIPVQFNRVTGDFNCGNNKLKSLQGAPQMVDGSFFCNDNDLESLQGAPREVGGAFDCYSNDQLTSLEGISRIIRIVNGKIYIPDTITSHILGLARIRGLRKVGKVIGAKRLQQAIDIINNNLGGRGMHQAQEQLLDAGLQEFAQL